MYVTIPSKMKVFRLLLLRRHFYGCSYINDKVRAKGYKALCEGIQKRTEPVSILDIQFITICSSLILFKMKMKNRMI